MPDTLNFYENHEASEIAPPPTGQVDQPFPLDGQPETLVDHGARSEDSMAQFTPAQTGSEIIWLLTRASDWARNERHAVVTIDHVLLALVNRQAGANALAAANVHSVTALDDELAVIVHRLPMAALGEGQTPVIHNSVLAILAHALGHARENGRDMSVTSDLVEAIRGTIERGVLASSGLAALRRRWPRLNEEAPALQLLTQIRDTQLTQSGAVSNLVSRGMNSIADEIAELKAKLRDLEPPPRKRPWARMPRLSLPRLGLHLRRS